MVQDLWMDADLQRPMLAAVLPTILFLFGLVLLKLFPVIEIPDYLAIHTLLELIAIAVSVMVFALAWSLRDKRDSCHRTLLGVGFLAVCLIDLAHTFSYPGMPALVTPSGPEKAINFWLAGRLVTACVLLIAAIIPGGNWRSFPSYTALMAALGIAGGIWWIGLFHEDWLPPTFVAGAGLTSFKVAVEYVVVGLFVLAAGIFFVNGYRARGTKRMWLGAAAWVLALAELYFTVYSTTSDVFNLLGHVYKVYAYYLVYHAIFAAGVAAPYRELELEQTWLESLLSSIPNPVWLKDPDGAYVACNVASKAITGREQADVVGKTDYELFDREHAELFRENDLLALSGGKVNINREWIDTAAAGNRLFETAKTPVRSPDGTLLGVLGIAHDITDQQAVAENLRQLTVSLEREIAERREAQARLTIVNQRYDAVIRAMPIPLMVVSPQGDILSWNEAAYRSFGYAEADMLSGSGRALFSGVSAEVFDDALRAAEPSNQFQGIEVTCRHKDGRDVPALLYQSAVRSAAGSILAIVFAIEDVSERRSIEAQLRQSQKMEAVGQLTAGIAHDFNNILAVVVGNLDMLLDDEAPPDKARALVRSALDASLRGAAMTQRLLAYSRKQPLEPTVIDLNQLLLNEVTLLTRSLEESVSVDVDVADHLWNVRADASRLQDAILNLALNARDAMPKGGTLTIRARNASLDDAFTARRPETVPGDYVELSVSDTGIGMSSELLEQATEPFFTTKPVGQGSGLGLSMVYGFVKQSGGHLDIESQAGKGTKVTIYLPRAAEEETDQPDERDLEDCPPARAGETVLLVEDDPDVRSMLMSYLGALDYEAIETEDGEAALEVLAGDRRVDLVLTDVVLPGGMRGPDIIQEAERLRPGLSALYISGYSENALSEDGELLEGVQLLTKPFLKKDMARRIRRILDEGKSARRGTRKTRKKRLEREEDQSSQG